LRNETQREQTNWAILCKLDMLSQRSHSLPSTSPKGDRTLFPQPNPNAIAFGTSEAYRTFSPQPNLNAIASLLFNPTQTRSPSAQAKLIALPPFNLTLTRSHPFSSTQPKRDRTLYPNIITPRSHNLPST